MEIHALSRRLKLFRKVGVFSKHPLSGSSIMEKRPTENRREIRGRSLFSDEGGYEPQPSDVRNAKQRAHGDKLVVGNAPLYFRQGSVGVETEPRLSQWWKILNS
jgi:hypothetical protein